MKAPLEIYLLAGVQAYHRTCSPVARRQMDYALQTVMEAPTLPHGETRIVSGFSELLETWVPGQDEVPPQVLIGYIWHDGQPPSLGLYYVALYQGDAPDAPAQRLRACNEAWAHLQSRP